MKLSKDELYILSFYRASELAGSLLFGRIAFHTNIDEIRIPLTRHCLEEAEHAWLWTKTIKDLGYIPLKVTHTYQSEYGKEFGLPQSILELLCLTQILERRVVQHFTYHLGLHKTHPLVKIALQKMLEDEAGHLGWVKEELDKYSAKHGSGGVGRLMNRMQKMDIKVYNRFSQTQVFKNFFKS